MSTFQEVARTARTSWLSGFTLGDARWRLKQLHALYQLVSANRDEIVAAISKERAVPAVLYEQEIALFVKDLHSHISKLTSKQQGKTAISALLGPFEIAERPWGVSTLFFNSDNPIRFGLSPLAASVAAGNVVILASTQGLESAFISCLQREWTKYLDSDSIFFVPGVSPSDVETEELDHVLILDASVAEYSSILQSPKAYFLPVSAGHNFVIVDEGRKNWNDIAQTVFENSIPQRLSSDSLSAIFVRKQEVEDFHASLVKLPSGAEAKITKDIRDRLLKQGCIQWGANIFSLDAASLNLQHDAGPSVGAILKVTQGSGAILVVTVTSLDEAVDQINSVAEPIAQVALLAPSSAKVVAYVRDHIEAAMFSLDSIFSAGHPVSTSFPALRSFSGTFSSSMFSRPQIIAQKPYAKIPTSIASVRAAYENLILPLQAEPRGERIGFFTQVEYVLKGIGLTVGVLGGIGMYYGVNALRHRS